jgi:ribosomal protein S6--L-glutamate ligase
MILSYHPIIAAERNIICAGRPPNERDRKAIRRAAAVILPQGCPEALYRMARGNCTHVFPNLDVRFDAPGKIGQTGLFVRLGVAHPKTRCYGSLAEFEAGPKPVDFPLVVKFDWGGQGDTVFKATRPRELADALQKAAAFEASGQFGFLIQPYVPCGQRSLRVVIIGSRILSYWRLQPRMGAFGTSVAGGARIDHGADPDLQAAGRAVVAGFCARTGLQLAGFDFIFGATERPQGRPTPLLLEINYYFGRTGLGGSQGFYAILAQEVDAWLARLGLAR